MKISDVKRRILILIEKVEFLCKIPLLPLGRKKRFLIKKFYLPDKKSILLI